MTQRPTERASDELVAITKAYDLVREMTQRVGKFPRPFRFILGDRILNNVYDVLDLLVEAKYTRDKWGLLDRANIKLEQVRFGRRLRELTTDYGAGKITLEEVKASLASWIGHLQHGDTWGLRARLLEAAVFRPGRTEREP